MRPAPMHAVITAGARVGGAFAERIGTDVKALAPLPGGNGRCLIDPAIDAARALGVAGIAVVGGAAVRAHCGARIDRVVDESPGGAENLRRALLAWPGQRLLYLTSDLPFVEPGGLAAFVAGCADAEIAMPLADADAYARRFPGRREHVMELGGERLANGSVFVIAPPAVDALLGIAPAFFDARKDALRMASLLGVELFARYLTRRLRIADVERRALRVLGVRARAVRHAAPELCFDVDTLDAWRFAWSHLGGTDTAGTSGPPFAPGAEG